ncbi:MAG: hypothetical protein J6R71_08895, partial [Bacteroidales bacterium]|nr:hypothetical protein [Bacteroidales bacterium]
MLFASCKDDYPYDDKEPEWLGESVYKYLSEDGHYTTYLSLIDALGYAETLDRTGSKTIFPANDKAYEAYFQSLGLSGKGSDVVKSMTKSQQQLLFNSTMLNMAYLDNMLANVPNSGQSDNSGEGIALVRASAASYLDSITFLDKDRLPAPEYWADYASRGGIYLMDNTSRPNVIFTPDFMLRLGLTESDWTQLFPDKPYDEVGFYVNGSHVSGNQKNITCKNGYLHIADEVVRPLQNMADVMAS